MSKRWARYNFFGTALDSFLPVSPPENMSCRKLQLPAELLALAWTQGSPTPEVLPPAATYEYFAVLQDCP